MSLWILMCWSIDLPDGEPVSEHPTLDAAVYAALAWIEAGRYAVPHWRTVYSVAELR